MTGQEMHGSGYVGRLAPSPTGLLHLGHARTFAEAARRAAAGVLRLRVEDLDRDRSRPEFGAALLDDLQWLGLCWQGEVVYQSARLPLYRAALEQLLRAGAAYPCTCSRRELARAAEDVAAPHEDADDEPVYGGRCRPAPGALPAAFAEGVSYRLRVPAGEPIAFDDALCGPQCFTAGQDFGDFLLWRRDGVPSYQLACVVDDAAMGVTEVVRGRDLLKSAARQIVLARALGLGSPAWAHTELVRDAAGVRLAKRHDALAIRTLRERGMSAAEVLGL